jgi:hypothetical protein
MLLGFSLVVLAGARLAAQGQFASMTDLKSGHSKSYLRIDSLASGRAQPTKEDEEAMKLEAQYFIHRFHAGRPDEMHQFQKDFAAFVFRATKGLPKDRNNSEFVNRFSPILVEQFKALLDLPFNANKHPILNVAPLLPEAAKFRNPAVGAYLSDLLAAKDKHDAIKLFAVRGMREFFPADILTEIDEPLKPAAVQRKKTDLRYVEGLLAFIERPVPANLSLEEKDGIRYLRREALASLARAQVPALYVSKGKPLEGPIAPVFLKVLARNVNPEPNLRERLEAAIGVCQIKLQGRFKNPITEYQPEPGLYLVGRFLDDFAGEYNKDTPNVRTKKPALLPWRIESKRLELAVRDLVSNAKGSTIEKQAKELETQVQPMLRVMSTGKGDPVNRIPDLNRFVGALKPKLPSPDSTRVSLFKSIPGAEIDLEPTQPAVVAEPMPATPKVEPKKSAPKPKTEPKKK